MCSILRLLSRLLPICLLLPGIVFAQVNETPQTETEAELIEPEPKTSQIERSIMPVTQWLENKIQNNSVIQPSIYIDDKPKDTNTSPFTLRQAIEIAKEQQAGTVLSAKKITDDVQTSFEVKILSETGIIKIITVNNNKEPLVE